jgi:hypothetical protein
MKRFFSSGVRMCLLNGYSGMKDFRKVLEDHKFRNQLIEKSKGKVRTKIIDDMLALNTYENKGKFQVVNGTDTSITKNIIDRMDVLSRTDLLEDTFMNDPNPEINFRKWADEGAFIGIKCSKSGKTESINTLVTFLVQKMWCAVLSRIDLKDETGCYNRDLARMGFITLDEPHAFPSVAKLLVGAIRESRKWRCGFNFAVHELNDFKELLPKLLAAGNNFIVYPTIADNYKAIKEYIGEFTVDEAMQTKEFHAIHSIYLNGKRTVYDALTLPKPETRFKLVEREVDPFKLCREQYGTDYKTIYYSAIGLPSAVKE